MRLFRCDRCGNALYFENWRCLQCGSDLAFLPDCMDLCAIDPAPADGPALWRRHQAPAGEAARRWRLCRHHAQTQACNFAIPAHDTHPLCVSCRQTRVLPDLSAPGNTERWYRLEVAKRRLFFTLACLGLVQPDPARAGPGQSGPAYEFLADLPGQPVTTGHAHGVITLNIAEADDDERVRRRVALHEPYRTLLGHLRHESGHYYWDRLVRDTPALPAFRDLFGDERADYAQALQAHYARSPLPEPGWQDAFITAYATAHPWEDWAETWAHYLHMVDLLETAAAFETRQQGSAVTGGAGDFDALVTRWVPLTLLVNSLNRSLGHGDAYPFALGPGARTKLRFVHDRIQAWRGGYGFSAPPP